MTYAEFGLFLMIVSGVFALLSICCAGIALFSVRNSHRTAIAIAAFICGLVSGVTYWITWSIASAL